MEYSNSTDPGLKGKFPFFSGEGATRELGFYLN
jgi:hypothetical protein